MANLNQLTVDNNTYDIEDATARAGLDNKLPLSGGTMTGNIVMGGHKVTGLPTPADAGDAVNKEYVDNDFELVEEITLANDTDTVTRQNTPSGAPYNYKKMLVLFDIPSGGTGNAYCYFHPNGVPNTYWSIAYILLSVTTAALYIEANNSFVYTIGISAPGEYSSVVKFGNIRENPASYKIDNLRLSANGTFKAGTKITVYGVKV